MLTNTSRGGMVKLRSVLKVGRGDTGLEETVDQIPCVWFEWGFWWLEGGLTKLCRLCEGVSYVNRHNPVWPGVTEGKGRYKYIGLLVCRIQVFSKEGNYSRIFELYCPYSIARSLHHLFVRFYLEVRQSLRGHSVSCRNRIIHAWSVN